MRGGRRAAVLGLAAATLPRPLRAAEPVDVALVLCADASGSIDADEFRLQKEGIAEAIADARVLAGIRSGPIGRIAVAYVEWGAPGGAATMVPWRLVGGAVPVGSVITDVVQANVDQAGLDRALENALGQRAGEHGGEECQNVETHALGLRTED